MIYLSHKKGVVYVEKSWIFSNKEVFAWRRNKTHWPSSVLLWKNCKIEKYMK